MVAGRGGPWIASHPWGGPRAAATGPRHLCDHALDKYPGLKIIINENQYLYKKIIN